MMKTLTLGLTKIKITRNTVTVTHSGNMGNTVDRSVRPNVDALLGDGAYDKLVAVEHSVTGSPDYYFVLKSKTTLEV